MKQRLWFIAALIGILFSVYTVRTHGQAGGALHPYVYGSLVASGDLTLDSTFNATKGDVLINPSGGNVGIGTTSPAAGLHGIVTSGEILWSNTDADDTNKINALGVEHYDVDEEPVWGLLQWVGVGVNSVRLGGSFASGNAATQISFYTAANSTTTTGTERWSINSAGQLISDANNANPSIAFSGDLTDGIDISGDDIVTTVIDGNTILSVEDTHVEFSENIYVVDDYIQLGEMTPPAGIADRAQIFAKDNGSGKTQLCVEFGTGAAQCFATEP